VTIPNKRNVTLTIVYQDIILGVSHTSSIEVANLCKSFAGSHKSVRIQALDNLCFSCSPGLIYGLIGPNGSGKTTCLRILSGLIQPTTGTVNVAGVDLMRNFDEVYKRVGYVSSEAQPYNYLTPREFLLYCGRLAQVGNLHERVDSLMQQLGIDRFQNRLCGALSTGMKQRVAIARAIVHEPEVLIFDEPTAGLDILSRRDVLDMLATHKSAGRTILFSTHSPAEAQALCDCLLIVSNGRIIAKGTTCEILTKSGTDNLEDAFITLLKYDNR
jgi:sodium transport system ATP-binding protein